jgi:hypothetical protein
MTVTARGSDGSGIERGGNAVQARYTGLQLGDDGGYVGSPRSGMRDAGSGGGLMSARREAVGTRHDQPITQPPALRLGH